MKQKEKMKVGIGFATGRKSFQKVLRSYIYNWKESGLVDDKSIALNLFVAYDLGYANTKAADFIKIHPELDEQINGKTFIGNSDIKKEIEELMLHNIITGEEADLLFGKGYAAKRNSVLYFAIKNRMRYLLFLDDDEYPVAVTNTKNTAIWGGQHVLSKHLEYLDEADITHGRHCGYISPIPVIEYNNILKESDFQNFIQAISNDILNWDKIKKVMKDGGVTYADPGVLTSNYAFEVQEQHHSKFISGANLGINLNDPRRVFPFYNPPGARGEDTFLSTCLSQRKVMRVPCYTFHDGFSTYNHLLEGVLPIHLKYITAEEKKTINRFYRACLGWIRYKPLLVYITRSDDYEATIRDMRKRLSDSVPKICEYFKQPDFMNVIVEFNKYNNEVEKHYLEFQAAKKAWSKIMDYLYSSNQNVLPSCSLLATPKRAL